MFTMKKRKVLWIKIILVIVCIIMLIWICKPAPTKKGIPSRTKFFLEPLTRSTILFQIMNDDVKIPWYFTHGKRYPKKDNNNNVSATKLLGYPYIENDRILEQLMFYPANYNEAKAKLNYKLIYIVNDRKAFGVNPGIDTFSQCPIKTCRITNRLKKNFKPDLFIFKNDYMELNFKRTNQTIYLLYILESPDTLKKLNSVKPHTFNWTATYRLDSDIVTPYEKWVYHNISEKQNDQNTNFAKKKTKKVAWFVSNCKASNYRLEYARSLSDYIEVDIYGPCGNYSCSKLDKPTCFKKLKTDYKFYLAFENSNCRNYITEKFFINSLQFNIVPIVMGAKPEQYRKVAPMNSFIHVDDFDSPKHLASYLDHLDRNDDEYNSYFKWKGTGEFIDTYFWCRLCALLNDRDIYKFPKSYEDIKHWWRGTKKDPICTGKKEHKTF